MKRKYQKPTSLDLGDVLLTAHGSCKSGGLAGNNSCVNGGQVNNPSDPGHCENGSVAFQGPGKCKMVAQLKLNVILEHQHSKRFNRIICSNIFYYLMR